MVGEALRDSLRKYELDNRVQREEASTARAQVHELKCDMMMKGLEFSRMENALKDELRSERNITSTCAKSLMPNSQRLLNWKASSCLRR